MEQKYTCPASQLQCVPFDKKEIVINEGQTGEKCFIIELGQIEISQIKAHNDAASRKPTKLLTLGPGDIFGELALLFDAPRAATAQAITSVTLWAITRSIFREIVNKTASTKLSARINFLAEVPAFRNMDPVKLAKLGSALEETEYAAGTNVITQGETGDRFYILESGNVDVLLDPLEPEEGDDEPIEDTPTEPVKVGSLQPGDWFGEMALLNDSPRAATVKALGAVRTLSVNRVQWHALLGTALPQMLRSTKLRERELSVHRDRMSTSGGDSAAAAAAMSAAGGAGETKVVAGGPPVVAVKKGRESIAGFDIQDLMSTRPDVNARFRVAWHPEFQGMTLNDLNELAVLGQGTYGRVTLVRDKQGGPSMALKQIQKAHIVRGGKVQNLILEKRVMQIMEHQFLLKLHRSFQDADSIYLLTEFVQGGEMWNLLYMLEGSKIKRANLPRTRCGGFYHEHARFYAGCVIEALAYLHGRGVAYRDLKPENMMIDTTGYVKLIDMGFAKPIPFKRGHIVSQRSFSLCGTPDYVSPELVLGKGHDHTVDYWAYGVYVYELMVGRTPFFDDDQTKVFQMICNSTKHLNYPRKLDSTTREFVSALLTANPNMRLGGTAAGSEGILQHEWFTWDDRFTWDDLRSKKYTAPFIPQVKGDSDVSNFDEYPAGHKVQKYSDPGDNLFEEF
jgi:serine/threonine protein kinase/CRP-like cAMP-binding protein